MQEANELFYAKMNLPNAADHCGMTHKEMKLTFFEYLKYNPQTMKTQVLDDFLDQKLFDQLEEQMMGMFFPWNYNEGIVLPDDGKYQFTHCFYQEYEPRSQYWSLVQPVFKDLNASSIIRCKANLTTKTTEPVVNDYHTDFPNCITAILYMNTNNVTIFRDGTKIHSKSNRLVVFDSNLQHVVSLVLM